VNEFVEKIEVVKNPIVKKLPNIQHLQTSVTGTLKSKEQIFKIISALIPYSSSLWNSERSFSKND
jgi:isochorismate synthase EntC